MKAYYLVFFITLMLSLFIEARTDKQWRWKLFWTFLPLFIYGAIRVNYGNDYPVYEEYFDLFHSYGYKIDRSHHAEIGYQFLNIIMPSFRSILVLNAFLLSLALGVFCYHSIPRKYLWLAVILIFLNPEKNIFGNLVGIRHGLVVCSFLLSYVFIQRRKWIPYFVITVALSNIHTSALIYMPLAYFVGNNKPLGKKELWVWGGVILFLLVASMSHLFDIISMIIGNSVLDRYEQALNESGSRRGLLISATSFAFVFMFALYFTDNKYRLSPNQNSLLRLGLLYSVTFLLGSLSARASYFYDLFFITSVINIFGDKKAPEIQRYAILLLAIAVSFYSMFHVWMGAEWWNHGTYHSLLGSW